MLRNWKYFYGSGSGSDFWQFTAGPAPYLGTVFKKILKKILPFYNEKLISFIKFQINCQMWMTKMLNKGNQIHNFILSLWALRWFHFIKAPSGTVINYGSGSAKVPTGNKIMVPVPLRQKLRFLRFRFLFRNTGISTFTLINFHKNWIGKCYPLREKSVVKNTLFGKKLGCSNTRLSLTLVDKTGKYP